MCANGPTTATWNVNILFQMQNVWHRKNFRGWVARRLILQTSPTLFRIVLENICLTGRMRILQSVSIFKQPYIDSIHSVITKIYIATQTGSPRAYGWQGQYGGEPRETQGKLWGLSSVPEQRVNHREGAVTSCGYYVVRKEWRVRSAQ